MRRRGRAATGMQARARSQSKFPKAENRFENAGESATEI